MDGVKTTVKATSNDPTAYDAVTNTDGLGTAALTAGTLCKVTYSDGKLTRTA